MFGVQGEAGLFGDAGAAERWGRGGVMAGEVAASMPVTFKENALLIVDELFLFHLCGFKWVVYF